MEYRLLLELGTTVRDRGIEPDATEGRIGPLRGASLLHNSSGHQWCSRVPVHLGPIYYARSVPGRRRSIPCTGVRIRALLFTLHEIHLSRLGVGLAARAVDVARSSTSLGGRRCGYLRRPACGNFSLSAAAECFVVASASYVRGTEPISIIPSVGCRGLLGRIASCSLVGAECEWLSCDLAPSEWSE